jgi:hypothetical protein
MNAIGWGMAIYIYELIINKSKDLVSIIIFISFLYDENTINIVGFHPYICGWKLIVNAFVVILAMNGWWD